MTTLPRLAALLAVALPLPPALAGAHDVDRARMEELVARLDERREELHIPGMAISIVKDGRVVLAEGLGVADVETRRPVTAETVFAIGSTTKTFTAALVAMGVDRGELSWELPVTHAIPWFRLPPAEGSDRVTLEDLLSHRTGLTRMPMLWVGATAPVPEIYRAMSEAEYEKPFREAWLYNNVTFAAAGLASAEAAGTTWEELLQKRILDPLGMDDTSTALTHLTENPDAALGYVWREDRGTFKHLPPRDLSRIAPSGAINSDVTDMARWLTVLLNNGSTPEGDRLISPENLLRCWKPQVAMPDGRHYGLGWMIGEYRGRDYFEHGGNIDGFASALAVMPEEGIGVSVLMNVTASTMQGEVIPLVFDALLPTEHADAGEPAAEQDLARFAGAYVFEALKGDMVVTVDGSGGLVCAIPNQGSTPLGEPDAEGWRPFAINPAIRVRFTPEGGPVTAMEFAQGPMKLSLPRRAEDGTIITPPSPFDEAELRLLTGGFRHDLLGETCAITLKDGALAMDVPSQMTYALAWDGANSRWRFRDHPDITLVFVQEGDEPASAIEFTQAGQTTTMPRVAAAAEGTLPTLDELGTRRRQHIGALKPDHTMRATGTIRLLQQGVRGTFVQVADGRERYADTSDLTPFGTIRSVFVPGTAFSSSPMSPRPETFEPGSPEYDVARAGHPWAPFAPLGWFAPGARVSGAEPFEGTDGAVVVTLSPEHAPEIRYYLDPETGRTLGIRSAVPAEGIGDIPIVAVFSDWRESGGVWTPRRVEIRNPFTGTSVMEYDEVEFGAPLPEQAFETEPTPEEVPAG